MTSGLSQWRKDIEKFKDELEPHCWYHGLRQNYDHLKPLLKEPGDFVVSHKNTHFYLNVMDDDKTIHHLPIYVKYGRIGHKLGTRTVFFKSPLEVIELRKTKTIFDNILLKRGIPRPSWDIKYKQVEFDCEKDLIADGKFSKVYKAMYTATNEEPITVAVKIFNEKNRTTEELMKARKTLHRDTESLRFYASPHVVQFYGVTCGLMPVMIVMEYCIGGSLESHLKKSGVNISNSELVIYTMEAAKGVLYLHNKKCIHRDLATRNCLISADGIVKISDYNLSKTLKNDFNPKELEESSHEGSGLGTALRWTAPECLTKPVKFSFKSDVWSFGALMYEIFNCGIPPFSDDKLQEWSPELIAHKIKQCRMPDIPEKTPDHLHVLLKRIWVSDPLKRPTMETIVEEMFGYINDLEESDEMNEFLKELDKFSVNNIPEVNRVSRSIYNIQDYL